MLPQQCPLPRACVRRRVYFVFSFSFSVFLFLLVCQFFLFFWFCFDGLRPLLVTSHCSLRSLANKLRSFVRSFVRSSALRQKHQLTLRDHWTDADPMHCVVCLVPVTFSVWLRWLLFRESRRRFTRELRELRRPFFLRFIKFLATLLRLTHGECAHVVCA